MAEQAPPGLLGIHTSSARNRSARHCENADVRRSGSERPNGRRKTRVRSNCRCSTASILRTPHSCGNGRRRCTASSIRRPVWRRGSWTTATATDSRPPPKLPAVAGHTVDGFSAGALTRDDVLDNITTYWVTKTAFSAARSYWENKVSGLNAANVSIPAGGNGLPERDI